MKNQGFTLIELVVVIVIVAILGVIAAPRFINLSGESVSATVRGVEAALKSALQLTQSKIVIDNAETSVDYNGEAISLTNGVPAASAGNMRAMLEISVPNSWTRNWETVPCDEPEFCLLGNMFVGKSGYVPIPDFPLGNDSDDRAAYIWPRGYVLESEGCYAFYISESTQQVYHTGSIVSGC